MQQFLPWIVIGLCLLAGAAAVILRPAALAGWLFFCGMALLAGEAWLDHQVKMAAIAGVVGPWLWESMLLKSAIPAVWLAFSLTYARGAARAFLRRWQWALLAAVVIPFGLVLGFAGGFFAIPEQGGHLTMRLQGPGKAWVITSLIITLAILIHLEKTFRTSVGMARWRIKYLILGVALIFGVRVYSLSQMLLFSSYDPQLADITLVSLLLGCGLIGIGYVRSCFGDFDIYPSRAMLQGSVTVILAGVYFVIVGVLAQAVAMLGGMANFPAQTLVLLLGVIGLTIMFLSERFRTTLRRFISRHFRRPEHDFRQIWTEFTRRTSSVLDSATLGKNAAEVISENFHVLGVTVFRVAADSPGLEWLHSTEKRGGITGLRVELDGERDGRQESGVGSREDGGRKLEEGTVAAIEAKRRWRATLHSGPPSIDDRREPMRTEDGERKSEVVAGWNLSALAGRSQPFVLEREPGAWAEALRDCCPKKFEHGGDRLAVPLVAAERLVGLVVLTDRVNGVPYTHEELDLLKCIGDQLASGLLNCSLTDEVLQAKELEAFQTLSTFFVHDLKNAANGLSLMLQNLPTHFDDPEFRVDAVRGMGRTVDRINRMILKLGSLRRELQLNVKSCRLDLLCAEVLDGLSVGLDGDKRLKRDLLPVPPQALDEEAMRSVVTNLVTNARESLNGGGEVTVSTRTDGRGVELVVSDNGCGMSPDFVNTLLFRPFHTTKTNGLGIGMFQCKKIIEAHGGRIRVESKPGNGTRFTVLVPLGNEPREE
jgi:signal transduction histidine kinase